MHIKVGQQWLTYAGKRITITSYNESEWLGRCEQTGQMIKYSDQGRCYVDGWSGMDLEKLVLDIGEPVDDENHSGTHACFPFPAPMKVSDSIASWPTREDLELRIAEPIESSPDAEALAVETLLAMGWRFDGQVWVQDESRKFPSPAEKVRSALDVQEGGNHYKQLRIQPVEYIHANSIPFAEGSVIKYVTRWRDKGGVKDLQKAKHFIDLLIELDAKYPTTAEA